MSAFNAEGAAFEAGKVALTRLRQLADGGKDFAFESTLSGRTLAASVRAWKMLGYSFHLVYLWLSDPRLAVARVAERVRAGGHYVAEETIVRRYYRGLSNFHHVYRPLADVGRVYDNSQSISPRLLARGTLAGVEVTDSRMEFPSGGGVK